MTVIRQPKTVVNIVNASEEVQNTPQKVLIVGQKTAGGSAASGSLVQNILNDNSEDTLFGADSMLAAMVRAYKKENKVSRVDAIPLDDNGTAVQATGNVTITGSATENGTLTVTIGSRQNHTYTITVNNGDVSNTVGNAIEAAINGDPKSLVSASNSLGDVTVTAKNGGTLGNDIGLEITGSVAGLSHSVTAMSGGANDPSLTGVFDVIGEERYQTIVWPYASDTSEVRTLLDARFNVDNKVQDGVAITASHDTLANHTATLNALNSQSLVFITDKTESETSYAGAALLEYSPVKSAMFAAIRALRLTDGASVSQYVITANGPLDSFGGPALASKPYFNTPLPNLPLIDIGKGWDDTEIETLHDAGGTVFGNNPAGKASIVGEVVTTYKTDSAGNSDITFKYLNYVDTASNAREYFFNNLRKRFAQSRLTEGEVLKGRDMANDIVIANYCTKLYQDLSGPEYVLLQAGEQAIKFFKQNLSVALDLSQGKATILMTVPIVTQLREILATLKIAFSAVQ